MKIAFIISLTLHVITIAAFVVKRIYYSNHPVAASPSEWSNTWNTERSELYSAAPIDSGDIVFVGDSHIERFLLNDFYPCRKIRNRGIGSNTSSQVLGRLNDILKGKPSKVFVQIGINDLSFGYTEKSVVDNITKILRLTVESNAKPILISLFPTGNDIHLNYMVAKINKSLAEYCSMFGVAFVDAHRLLLKDGRLNPELTSDNVHLNNKGYKVWQAAIDPYLK